MDYYFKANIRRMEDCLEEYSTYNKFERLDKMFYISNCFNEILKPSCVKYFDENLIIKIHDMILKLDCLSALVRLDSILINNYCGSNYKKILEEDINKNVVELVEKRLELYITEGLNYQLTVEDGYLAKPFEYNNLILNKYGRYMVKDTLSAVEYLEFCLKKIDINVNIIERIYQNFTTKQLAFIYAQLNYCEYINGFSFEYGSADSYVHDANERIFEVMWKRNNSEKIIFMRTICELGYCNIAIGICAMLIDLYRTMDQTSICCMLREILGVRKFGVIRCDSESEVVQYLESSQRIKKLRDEDIRRGVKLDIIYNYSMKSTYGRENSYYLR